MLHALSLQIINGVLSSLPTALLVALGTTLIRRMCSRDKDGK
ncbi:hypothetical protein [Streptomyces violascens]